MGGLYDICNSIFVGNNRRTHGIRHLSIHHDRSQQPSLSVLVNNNTTIPEFDQDENQYGDQ